MIRHLGYACQNLSLAQGRRPKNRLLTDRTLRMDRFTLERVGELAVRNTEDLLPILQWNAANGIRFFRIGSGVFPFMDHPTLKYTLHDLALHHYEAVVANLAAAGQYAKSEGMRLSCHPGPVHLLGITQSRYCGQEHLVPRDALAACRPVGIR